MTFNAQDMEQLKAARALFARLSKEAAEWRDELNGHSGMDELSFILDDMAVSVRQVLEDHLPELDDVTAKYRQRGARAGWNKEDFELDRADTMRKAI